MEPLKDPISVRVSRLNSQLVSNKVVENSLLTREGLLDALTVLYEECNSECMKKLDGQIVSFVDKHRGALNEVKRQRVNITDFDVHSVIGRGHFGEVHVVCEKQTGDVYAMKTVKKSACLSQKGISFDEERNIMARSTSPWLTSLQYAFQDGNNLYFIMEYHPGGDLLGLLHRQGGTVPESAASFYLAELVVALNDLHSMGYVHRDVKPDNILLDRCGHVKLADFGSSCKVNAKGCVVEGVPVGTPDYVAPEVLQSVDNKNGRNSGYNISCDYWSVGVLAYQLTVGISPFAGSNTTSTYSKIMNYHANLKFPPDLVLSQAYVSLIKGLLTDSSVRLTFEQILKHPLFKKIDFSGLRNQVPPYVPKVDAVDDTSNFFDVPSKKNEPDIDNFKTKTQFSGKHLPFVGFTYTHDLYQYKRSYGGQDVKHEKVEELQKEVRGLQKKLKSVQQLTEEKQGLESKFEEKNRHLESLENLRDRLERDLANTISECSALKRTLELERKDRADLERRALDLIKSAKIKWENSEKNKIGALTLELEQQTEKINQLQATNSMLNEQLQHALQIENKHKTSLENVQQMNRQSIVGLESRIEKISVDSQEKIVELQSKLSEEARQRNLLQNQVTAAQYTQASLKEKLKSSEENCNGLLIKLEANQKLIRELENKIATLESSSRAIQEERVKVQKLQEQVVKLQNDQKVQELEAELKKATENCNVLEKQIEALKEELNASTASWEERKASVAKQLEDVQKELSTVLEDRASLECKLQDAALSEQTNKIKVQTLEQLLEKLESGVSRLESDSERENLLKEQIQRLEQQLIQVHETAAIEKQELAQLKSKFWRLEKDFNNAEIDKRIYKRELKELEDEKDKLSSEIGQLKRQLDESTNMHESALQELAGLNENLAKEVMKLQEWSKHLEEKSEATRDRCDEEKRLVTNLRSDLSAKEAEIARLLKNFEISKQEKNELCRELEKEEARREKLTNESEQATLQIDALNNELENYRRQLQNAQLNLDTLREACTLLENQLIEYENIHAAYETKQQSLYANTERLISDLSEAREQIQNTKKLVNEERSLKLQAEMRSKRLEEDVECLRNECVAYKQQCVEFRQCSSSLTEELTCAEEKLTDYEVTIKSYERQISNLITENKMLKEEASAQLTHLHDVKESNYQLEQQLLESKRTNEELMESLHELQETLNQKSTFFREREVKADGTIQQQTKLIDFLQCKIDESKKKKTLADKFFGSSKKENQPPITLHYKDLENLLYKERDANKELREEVAKLRAELGKEVKCETSPMSPRTKHTLEKLALSPTNQRNLLRQNSTQRMRHNIPHRFESKLCTKVTKCTHCSNQVLLGRNVKYCTECHVYVHPNCAKYLPKTCGVPQAFVKHYSDSLTKQSSCEENIQPIKKELEVIDVEGWVKIPMKNTLKWEKSYACLTPTALKIYTENPADANARLVQSLELHPADCHGSVILEPVPSEISIPVATSDLPFVLKVEVIPNTTCWPAKSLVLMSLSTEEKDKWFKALQGVFQMKDVKYAGDLVVKYSDLHVNCVVDLENGAKVLGTEEGLYAYNKALLHIAGPLHVLQVQLVHAVNLAVMIADVNKFLISCDLNHLKDLSLCASCSKPTLMFKSINVNNMEGFHTLQVSNSKKHVTLAVATSKQLIIMSYDYKLCDFIPMMALDTAQPTSCLLFTDNSLIVGTNKFFEVDLVSFEADEFVDESDKKLSQAVVCYSVGSYPFAVWQVAPKEFLLCFQEFAVFVDDFGRASRATDIKWSRLPRAVHYQAPYLYLTQFSSVEVVKISADTCNLMRNSLESLVNIDSFKLDLKSPRFVGSAKGGIFVDLGGEVRFVEARRLDEGYDEAGSEEFSFTSSMVQSLDGDLSDESTSSQDFVHRQKKVTFTDL